MPIWDALPDRPLDRERVLSLWRRDDVHGVLVRYDHAVEDRMAALWVATDRAFHHLVHGADGWERDRHVARDADTDAFAQLVNQGVMDDDAVPFATFVEATGSSGDRSHVVKEPPPSFIRSGAVEAADGTPLMDRDEADAIEGVLADDPLPDLGDLKEADDLVLAAPARPPAGAWSVAE